MGVRRLLLDAAAEMGAPPGDGGKAPIGGDFDTGMVIILAALLCALIGALGLNSIVRCAMRCGGGGGAEAEAAEGGMKKRQLRRIPVAEYGEGAGISGAECAICLADFAEGEKVRVLPRCGHGFHVACIDRWLSSRSSCPNCRHSLLESKPGGGGGRRPESESGGGLVVAVEAARV